MEQAIGEEGKEQSAMSLEGGWEGELFC